MKYWLRASIAWLSLCSLSAFASISLDFATSPNQDSDKIALVMQNPQLESELAQQINAQSNGEFMRQLEQITFKPDQAKSFTLYGIGKYKQVFVHVANRNDIQTGPEWQALGGQSVAWLSKSAGSEPLNVVLDLPSADVSALANFALGASLRGYHFDRYKKADNKPTSLNVALVHALAADAATAYQQDLTHVAKGVYLARDMASEPGKTIYPESFVQRVKTLFKGIDNVDIDVLDVKDMQKRNMGALLGVGKGSINDPRLLVIEYRGGAKDSAPIALVGKGITFDTGGISLKPNNGMWAMKSDLSGAAAVAGTLLAVASRGEAINLVGLMPLAENMPSQDAIRPGDVLETMHGTSIEIISTDAEGRLILADAVTYAQREFKPKMLVNIATLTGSAARALSDEYAAVITRDFALSTEMMAVGEAAGEDVWPLPLHPNHFEQIESDIADIKNSGAGNPGASIGAAVVGTFVDENLPWVHLDIAGVDYLSSDTDIAPKGAAGWGVRFMDQLVRQHAQAAQ
ncbi:leucyl aminopeptidase family protein [Alteromonas flava]|uniref:leucyl aminopeptidase family protein n=1 Tax=Alteromonas flava TaxID=2048003 RepID=UPI000C28BED3|nr:leucyl aminopeptidase [Alteromonas flava]